MPEKSRKHPQPISRVELQKIFQNDPEGAAAATLVLEDATDNFLDENPNWPYADEFRQLLELEGKRTPEQENRLAELIEREMQLSKEFLLELALKTYANQNDYEIIKQ